MPGLASIFHRPLFRRSKLFRQSDGAAAIRGVATSPLSLRADEADDSSTRERSTRSEAERLERVAAYACAGYFNLGYTFEMFHLAGELPPPE